MDEAIIIRLKIYTTLQVKNIGVFSDSQVVINYIKVEFEAMKKQIVKYVAKILQSIKDFPQCEISHIVRSKKSSRCID